MKKFMTMAATLMVAVGLFSSCTKDDKEVDERSGREANTYAMVSIALNGQGGVRADTDDPNKNYHHQGKWEGVDDVKRFAIFFIDKTSEVLETPIVEDAASWTPVRGDKTTIYKPQKPFPMKAGEKYMYVVVNPSDGLITKLGKANSKQNFEEIWKQLEAGGSVLDKDGEASVLVSENMANASNYKTDNLYKSDQDSIKTFAKYENSKDIITMTSKVQEVDVKSDVSATAAIQESSPNYFRTEVRRVAARVMEQKKLIHLK